MSKKAKGVPTSGARLQKWLANPGLRAKLPDSALPAAQLAQRRLNHRDPIDVQATRDVNTQYAPQESLLKGALSASDQQSANVASWFQNYQNQVNTSNQAIQQAYQKGQQDAVSIGQQLSQAGGAQGAQADQAMATDAAQRGATVAPSVAQVGQQAGGVRRDLAGSFAAMLASQGVNANVAGQDRSRIAAGQGTDALLKELQYRRGIMGQQTTLAKEKGTAKLTRADTLRDAAHKSLLEDAAFGLNQTKAATDAAAKAESAARARGNARRDAKKLSDAEAKDNYQRAHGLGPYKPASAGKTPKKRKPGSGPGSLSPDKEQKIVQHVRGAASTVRDAMKQAGDKGSLAHLRGGLLAGKVGGVKYTDDEITMAYDLYQNDGQLTPAGVAAAHRLGIHVNGNFKIAPTPTNGGGTDVVGGGV